MILRGRLLVVKDDDCRKKSSSLSFVETFLVHHYIGHRLLKPIPFVEQLHVLSASAS